MNKLKELTEHKGIKLTECKTSVQIDALPEKVQEALSQYANVSNFHFGVEHSVARDDGKNKACLGAVRTCTVRDMGMKITLVERIIEYKEGQYYRYEVFKWKNFPLKVMFFAFSFKENPDGYTTLTLIQNYRLNPGFITGLMKWKIKALQRQILTGYKHYIETGEGNCTQKEILQKIACQNVVFTTQ